MLKFCTFLFFITLSLNTNAHVQGAKITFSVQSGKILNLSIPRTTLEKIFTKKDWDIVDITKSETNFDLEIGNFYNWYNGIDQQGNITLKMCGNKICKYIEIGSLQDPLTVQEKMSSQVERELIFDKDIRKLRYSQRKEYEGEWECTEHIWYADLEKRTDYKTKITLVKKGTNIKVSGMKISIAGKIRPLGNCQN